jgi:hypothetical protein
VEVDLDIHEKVKCTEVDLASDDERKIWASFFQRTICTSHLAHVLGKLFHVSANWACSAQNPCRRIVKFVSNTP